MNFEGAGTLFKKEVLRFYKVGFQTVAVPVLTAVLDLLIDGECERLRLSTTVRVGDGDGVSTCSEACEVFGGSAVAPQVSIWRGTRTRDGDIDLTIARGTYGLLVDTGDGDVGINGGDGGGCISGTTLDVGGGD